MTGVTRILLSCAIVILLGGQVSEAQSAVTRTEAIDAQPLTSALNDFAKHTGLQLIYVSDVALGVQSKGARAGLSAEEALRELLRETGLSYEFLNERTVAIRTAESAPGSDSSRTPSTPQAFINFEATDPRSERKPGFWDRFRLAQNDQSSRTSDSEADKEPSRPDLPSPQETGKAIPEIIVTAQKRKERLIDVPMSVAALSGDELEAKGIRSINDLSHAVPSLSVRESGPGQQLITIRGIGNGRGSSSLVGIYLDDAPLSSIPFSQVDLRVDDLERVEVLRGPQGTLYGEGSVGGTIRFITNQPELDRVSGAVKTSLSSTTDADSLGTDIRGVFNLPVVENVFGLRIAASYEDASGWIDQPAASREHINGYELRSARLSALWRPLERMDISASSLIHRVDGDGQSLVNVFPPEASDFINQADPTRPTYLTDDYDVHNVAIRYDLGFATLLSATSYMDKEATNLNVNIWQTATPSAPLTSTSVAATYAARSFSQELRLDSSGTGPWKWTAGLFYRDAQDDIGSVIDVGSGTTIVASGIRSRSVNDSESWAAFADAKYALTDRVEVGAGVRYFEDHRRTRDLVGNTSVSGKFDSLDPRIYSILSLTDNVKVYANAATGFRSGGFNSAAVIAAGGPEKFDPESVRSYELGVKAALPQVRLRTELSVFYSEYDDIQVIGLIPSFAVTSVTSNAGKARIRGAEWELHWAPTDILELAVNGGLTDAEFTSINATRTTFLPGDPIDFVPEYSYALSAAATVPLSATARSLVARVDYSAQGGTTNTNRAANLLQPIQKSETLSFLNASVGLRGGPWSVELFAQNILDERDLLFPSVFGFTAQARPRTVGLRANYSF